ncbi:MAG: 2-octaprenyl-6-methoxyphenyl hydroxylase [Gammaproteobacteria bacterium]
MGADFDVLIIGGGLVGASLACALGEQPLRVGVVEAVPLAVTAQPGYDDRAIALARGTQRIFSTLGIWDRLAVSATPIHRIHVSDRGRFGFAYLDRQEEGVEALGYVVPARAIGTALMARLKQQSAVEILCPAQLERLNVTKTGAGIQLSENGSSRQVTARLVVAADGARSAVREQLAMPVDDWNYGQTAVVANLTTQLANRNIAFERFTDTGPLAVLPMGEHRCTVVWTIDNDRVAAVLGYSDEEFIAHLQECFGYRLGRLRKPGTRRAYELRLVRARHPVQARVALIGNAAHTLHPIAGQGFNLGVRDVATLAEVLVDAARERADIGSDEVLTRYAEWRKRDHTRVIAFTDGLIRLFTNPLTGVAVARNLGMLGLGCLPPAKRFFSRLAMGQTGKLPRLSRGLPL